MNAKLEEVFDLNFIELLQLVPNNPIVRGLVLRMTGKQPGPECRTFEQLKQWVEANCVRRRRAAYRSHESVPGILVKVTFSQKEYGRASYTVLQQGADEFSIGANELVDIIREVIGAGGGMDEVMESITQLIQDDGWDRCEPSMDDWGDYEYYDHNANDSDSADTEYETAEVRRQILRFVRGLHPELADQLETT